MDVAEETSGATVAGKDELPLNSGGSPLDKNGSLGKNSGDSGCGDDGEDEISRSQVVQEGASQALAGREAEDINSDQIAAEKDGLSIETKKGLGSETDGLNSSSVEGRIENDGRDGKASLLPDDGDSIASSITSPVDKQATATTSSPDRSEIMTKGKGLRKWRRRRRELVVKDGSAGLDLHRALKRGLSNIDLVNAPAQPGAMDIRLKTEELGASMDSTVPLEFTPTLNFGTPLPISESGSVSDVRNIFVSSMVSENSEDQSSKSSTAANFPTTKHDSEVSGVRENEQVKGTVLVQGAETQLEEKNSDDGTKKFRAERGNDQEFADESPGNHMEGEGSSKIDEQLNDQADSYSSVESDSRSCARVGSSAAAVLISTNGCFADHRNGRWTQEGKQSWSSDCDGEVNQFGCRDSKAGDEDEKNKFEEAHSAYYHENGVELESELRKEESDDDTSGPKFQTVAETDRIFEQEGTNKGERVRPVKPLNQNRKSSFGGDSWTESLAQLQVVQEALKKEIQKVGVMRREAVSRPDISSHILGSTDKHEKIIPTSSDADSGYQIEENGFPSIELLPSLMYHRVMVLESRLKDAEKMIQHKEVRIKELEAALGEANLVKDGSDGELQSLGKMLNEWEMEVERLFMDKVEAETRYFVVNEANNEMRSLIEGELPLVEAHRVLLEEQTQMLNKLKEAEGHALLLKSRAEELENACVNLSATERDLKMTEQSPVFFSSSCCPAVMCNIAWPDNRFHWQANRFSSKREGKVNEVTWCCALHVTDGDSASKNLPTLWYRLFLRSHSQSFEPAVVFRGNV
ncbi:WPP domain-interacting protein 2 [Nymphaea thermarum]|nr:WPP domain-interacting protein 2 [Nymphaea thermarum]